MKNKYRIIIIVVLFFLVILFLPFKFPYRLQSTGVILPIKEWTLGRTTDGNLISSSKDNKTGFLNSYTINEFQRGDDAKFILNSNAIAKNFVVKGDTIGKIYSNEEEIRLIQLQGELGILKSELQIYKTGMKPADVQVAANNLALAKQQYETQKKLTKRTEDLFKDSLVSPQIYEISLNELKVKELNVSIAESNYNSAMTGAKPEQSEYILAKINSYEDQIKKIKTRLNHFNIIAPFSGAIVQKKAFYNQFSSMQNSAIASDFNVIVEIADTTSFVALLPIEVAEMKFLKIGSRVTIKFDNSKNIMDGVVYNIDNVVQIINGKQVCFITAIFENKNHNLLPGIFIESEINCESITILEHLYRALQLIN